MAFNSYNFVLYFLPVFVLGYYLTGRICRRICPNRRLFAQQLFSIAASAFFYYLNDSSSLWWIVLLTLVINYVIVRLFRNVTNAGRKKLLLAGSISFNIAVLFIFKYLQTALYFLDLFLGTSMGDTPIPSPAGLSYITFQQIIYLVDAYRNETESDTVCDYLTYITWFPKILSGPITSRETVTKPFHENESFRVSEAHAAETTPETLLSADAMSGTDVKQTHHRHRTPVSGAVSENGDICGRILSGLVLLCLGLGKKVLIADVLATAVDWGFDQIDMLTAADAIIIMLSYTFQIYFDFSGYTDMARGISRMVGIELPVNFNSPYQSLSIRDFWKRWHISLTGFLTRYIYIPLGGSRKGKQRTWINTMAVFLISGIWHGSAPSYVLWGALNGILSVFNRETSAVWDKIPKLIRWAINFLCLNVLFLLFRAQSIHKFLKILQTMLGGTMQVSSGLLEEMAYMAPISGMSGALVIMLYLAACIVICLLPHNTNEIQPDGSNIRIPQMALAAVLLITSLFYMGEVGSFVYFNF